VDSLLREKKDFRHKLSCTDVSKTTLKLIQNVIDEYYEELHRKEAKKINIDLSKLNVIRIAADITREKLLVDEEETQDTVYAAEVERTHEIAEMSDGDPLDTDEKELLIALLYNEDITAAAKKSGKMPSILADSINEKMFEVFSDNIIDFSEDIPRLIEDYTDELKEMFHKE
jgi:hypothetical protein